MLLYSSFGANQAQGQVSSEAALELYAYNPEWLHLLYYERTSEKTRAGFKSLVTSRAFFVSDAGNHDPLAELKATVKLLSEDQTTKMNPQCAYPARYEILKRHFKLRESVVCPQLDTWLKSYDPSGVEIVYTSQFIANPASVFGHAFLLMPSDNQVEALWSTFNFAAAIPSDANPFAYAWGGLTGWYSGDYSILPYYQRLYQYSAIENRDLWRYPIKLTKSELLTLMKHFWEVIHLAKFRYYFLDENCAGYILKSLAAVLPDVSGSSNGSVYVHPVDVIKTLKANGRLGEPTRIPSSFEIFRTRYDQLSAEDRAIFFQLIESQRDITPNISLQVLDSIVDYLSLERTKNDGELSEALLALERTAFIARAKLAPRTSAEVATKRPPHESHESMRGSLGFNKIGAERQVLLGYRLAIHDLLEDDAGFLQESSVEAFSGTVSASRDEVKVNVRVKDFTILKIENYPPFYHVDPKGAWLIHLGLRDNLYHTESNRYQPFGHFAYGGATPLLRSVAFAMFSSEFFGHGPQSPFYTGIEGGLLFDFEFAHIMARINLSTNPFGRGQNPKWNGQLAVGLPVNHQNSVTLASERECLYKNELCWFEFGAAWRTYF